MRFQTQMMYFADPAVWLKSGLAGLVFHELCKTKSTKS